MTCPDCGMRRATDDDLHACNLHNGCAHCEALCWQDFAARCDVNDLHAEVERLRTAIAEATRERDAAVADRNRAEQMRSEYRVQLGAAERVVDAARVLLHTKGGDDALDEFNATNALQVALAAYDRKGE